MSEKGTGTAQAQENEIKKGMKIYTKVGISFAVLSIILITSISWISYELMKNQIFQFYTENVISDAVSAAGLVDGGLAVEALKTGEISSELKAQCDQLDFMKRVNGLNYLYLFTIDDTGVNYIYTAVTSEALRSETLPLGYHEAFEDGDEEMRRVLTTGEASSSLTVGGSTWGYLASAFAPVTDKSGNVVALMGADYDMNAIMQRVKTVVFAAVAGVTVIVLLFICLMMFFTDRTIIKPIKFLTAHASDMISNFSNAGDGQLAVQEVHLKNRDEIGTLGHAFNKMAHDLEHYITEVQSVTAEKERIETELDVARKIQAMFLPRLEPPFTTMAGKRFGIYASMEPAKAVGGDFYDFFMIDNEHLGVTIADVSGKGVPAALFMAISKTILKNQMLMGKNPADALMASNSQLAETNDENMFVTVFTGILELHSGVFTYGNAGHNLPLIYSKENNRYDWLAMKPNFVLAAMPGMKYQEHSVTLHKGDCLLLYTDGVTEAMNEKDELYGDAGLLQFANEQMIRPEQTLGVRTNTLKESIRTFRGNAQQSDDITILMLQYEGDN